MGEPRRYGHTLTGETFKRLCGENATGEERLKTAARYTALLTEIWRGNRKIGGVLHFVSLGYSRPNDQTSDNFTDVVKQTYEPNFLEYVPDAFAPVTILTRYFEAFVKAGEKEAIPFTCINDMRSDFDGEIRGEIFGADGKPIFSKSEAVKMPAMGKTDLQVEIGVPALPGKYDMHAPLFKKGADKKSTRSVRYLNVE